MYYNDLQYMRITSLAPLATCKVYTANCCCGIILHLLLTATNKKNTVCVHTVFLYTQYMYVIVSR